MVVAIVAATDLVQLPTRCQSQVKVIDRSGSPTDPFSGAQENLAGHATRFNRLVDPGTSWRLVDTLGMFRTIGAIGPIPKSLEAMWLSGVSGLGNCGGRENGIL